MFGLSFISKKGKRVKSLIRQCGILIDDSRTINRMSQRRPDRKYAARVTLPPCLAGRRLGGGGGGEEGHI